MFMIFKTCSRFEKNDHDLRYCSRICKNRIMTLKKCSSFHKQVCVVKKILGDTPRVVVETCSSKFSCDSLRQKLYLGRHEKAQCMKKDSTSCLGNTLNNMRHSKWNKCYEGDHPKKITLLATMYNARRT